MVKAQKLTENDGWPQARDYDNVTQEFMATVIREYHTQLCTQAPMPDHTQETALLNVSWARGCQVTSINLAQSPQLVKLMSVLHHFSPAKHPPFCMLQVTIQGSQVHGQLKTKLQPLVKAMYSFYSSQSKSTIKKNCTLAKELKEGMNFAFRHMAAQEDGWHRFLKAPLIQKIINMMWFANKHDDSVMFPDHFKPFPHPALALVLTSIYEWVTSMQMDVASTIQEYHSVFELHLNCLREFEEATKEFEVLPGICKKVYEVGCVHSGAAPLIKQSQPTVSTQIIADAIKKYQEGSTTDNKSE
ncbi:hypothetical protein EDC04DRAFT_2897569 [Pisolithus marmoratus]|nr:hypothetical protein EDC04DRAFT_2897569 [Pisolithus marmoratus]